MYVFIVIKGTSREIIGVFAFREDAEAVMAKLSGGKSIVSIQREYVQGSEMLIDATLRSK